MQETKENETRKRLVGEIFNDFESRKNIVGLYSLLLEIDRRQCPEAYVVAKERV